MSGVLLLVFMAAFSFLANAQSPTAPALNFNIFLQEHAEMGYSESEGPTAIGGDLSLINSGHAFAIHSGGTFEVDGMKISLLVGGKVNYLTGNSYNVKNGYVKIGVQNGSVAWYTDEAGTGYPPVRITPSASYNGNPRFELLDIKADQYSPKLSVSNKPVFQSGLIDFNAAFTQLKANSTSLSSCTDNAYLTESNGTLIPGRTNLPSQVKITLNDGINILNISGTEINKLSELTFNNTPSASRVLIVNVNAPGSFAWNVFNSAGSFGGLAGCQYILYNFYNTTSLTIQGNGAVEGTVLAPFAAVNKKNNNANIEGQLIAKSFKQEAGGEIHYAVFQPSTTGCGTPPVTTTASFTINNDAQCKAGNSFVFTNSSTGDAPLSYKWTFGDGGTSTSTNPSYTYATAGTYTVKLVVTAAGGKDSVSKTVNVWAMPAAGFTVNNNEQVLSGNSFAFTTSNHVSGNTYQWWFGDGGTSSVQNPVHSYTATGTYTVKQVVNSNKGCSDTTTLVVKVKANPTTASFTINNDAQCKAGNSFVFTNSSTGDAPLSYKWTFGDGGTSTSTNPSYTYATAGTYTVKLVVTAAGGKDSVSKTVNVWAMPSAGFTVNNNEQALSGNSFEFTTTNHVSGNTYQWWFGDGGTSSVQNPVHSYTATGTYTVKQVVNSNKGCSDTTTLVVKVKANPTTASFTINNDAQCKAGNSFTFTNSSTGDAPLSYKWTFGDGGTSTSTNPSYTYAAAGTYIVKLVVTAAGGKDSVSKTVNVWAMPSAGFTVNNNEQALSGNSFEFTTTNHASGNTYQWWFGDGGTSSVQNPVHSYTATGTYTVKQVVNSDKGCSDTTTLIVKVKANPTTASFTINNDAQCLSGNSFVFTSSVSGDGPFTYQWSFGDGGTSADSEPVYIYSAAGTYTVTLIVNGAGGADTVTNDVTVTASPVAGFTVNQENQELTGNSFVFTTINPDGANNYHWSFGDNTFSTDINPVKSYDSAGLYQVVQIVSAISGCSDTFIKQVVVICDSVSSGNDGGIESESLGGLVNRRDFLRIKNSVDSRVNYATLPMLAARAPYAAAKRTKGSLELNGMIPQQLAEGDAVYITSPTDLLSITKAVDVLSVDYTRNQKAKAVVLGIKTLDKAYSHTKSICDRFRGSELLFVDTVNIRGFDFTRFAMKRDGGIVEYALAFVIGKDTRRNNYTLQTNWLISEYAPDEEVYNFQVWSANPQDAVKLAGDVLDNLDLDQSVEQINQVKLPKAYITYGMRDKANLVVRIENTAAQAEARIVFEERANEDGDVKLIEFPVTLKPGRENVFELPIRDGYEYQGRVYMNDVLEDEVYMADGNWGIDYDSDNTTVHQFTRGNNPERVYRDNEYPLYRNVTLKAKNRSYISVYKAIRSGTEKADLTAYRSVKFFAKGTGRVEIRLTRDSIVDWKSQYKTEISLDEYGKEYAVSFDDFYSDRIDAAFNPKDIKTIVFTFITANGKEENVDFHISGVSFSAEQVLSKRGLDSRTMEIAPNPNNGRFECFFNSEEERTLDFTITDVTGRVVFARTVNAVVGVNSVSVDLNTPGGSVLMISLKGKDLFYDAKKLIIK